MIPLLFVDSAKEKAEVEADVRQILQMYHHGQANNAWINPLNRMKPLDVTKVLMGIMSDRENVKRFQTEHSLWKKRQEYSYDDILKVSENVVQSFYCDLLLPSSSGKQKVS